MKVLNKKLIEDISKLRDEPDWLLQWRLNAFEKWKKMKEPHWAEIDYKPIDYDSLNYYNIPQKIDNSEYCIEKGTDSTQGESMNLQQILKNHC